MIDQVEDEYLVVGEKKYIYSDPSIREKCLELLKEKEKIKLMVKDHIIYGFEIGGMSYIGSRLAPTSYGWTITS